MSPDAFFEQFCRASSVKTVYFRKEVYKKLPLEILKYTQRECYGNPYIFIKYAELTEALNDPTKKIVFLGQHGNVEFKCGTK